MLRDQLIHDWVAERFPGQTVTIKPASADASFRRYFRLTLPEGETRILMDAPPEKEDCRPFVAVARLFEEAGLNAPRVLFEDHERGFLLLTDLGNALYLETLHSEDKRANALFADAISALIIWQKSSRPGVLPPYDQALLKRELDLFPDWFLKRHLNITLNDQQQETLDATFGFLIDNALAQPPVFVHRDYMPRNLMLGIPLSPAPASGRGEICAPLRVVQTNPGILDFQDAVYGPITYDVASLFRDAFISWDEERELDWVARYWQQARAADLPVPTDFAVFWRDYELMGLQRHLKVLGIFCRLNYRDGKDRYLTDLPRFLTYVRRTASRYDELAPFRALLDSLPIQQ